MAATRNPTKKSGNSAGKVKDLETLLERRNSTPEQATKIDREIVRRFRCRRAVHILDMSGFSLSTQRHGIIHHLAKIQRMRGIVALAVADVKGVLLKFEADNAYSVFSTVNGAVNASHGILRRVREVNSNADPEDHIQVAMGIGYGSILLAEDDFFGDEVNQASKLGEDTARPGEVLLTEQAVKAVRGGAHRIEQMNLSISGIHLEAGRLLPNV
jgi:adenylate cyclase